MKAASFAVGCALTLASWASPPPAAAPANVVASRDGNFEFTVPAGWAVEHSEGQPSFVTLSKNDEQLALTFHASNPGKWTVDTLMAAQDEAARSSFGDVQLTSKRDLKAPGGPGALWVYALKGAEGDPLTPLTGCVILRAGGVGVLGVAVERETLDAAEAVILSIRPITKDE